jgi:aspartate kinase
MQVFKFGGASVKDADAVRNVARILRDYAPRQVVVVISAMGKTTNVLEKLTGAWFDQTGDISSFFETVRGYHRGIIKDLFPDTNDPVYDSVEQLLSELENCLQRNPRFAFDQEYDQVVGYGEIISSTIVHHYLLKEGMNSNLTDVRKLIHTDSTFRDARVDWPLTRESIKAKLDPVFALEGNQIILTQGFLGRNPEGITTTLGREGSDYTAAIFAWALDAEEMVIWKDVPGLLNADPKYFSKTRRLASISYREAIELAYYGATIIHPKTIKPLQNKGIPLRVKSFLDPGAKGTIIHHDSASDALIPSFIFKVNQVLVSISPKDFSFIDESNLSYILNLFARSSVHLHLMQNSAISFTVCIDNNERRLKQLFEELGKEFNIRFNSGLELITIRHYDQATIARVLEEDKTVLLEMRSRQTAQFVVKPGILYW